MIPDYSVHIIPIMDYVENEKNKAPRESKKRDYESEILKVIKKYGELKTSSIKEKVNFSRDKTVKTLRALKHQGLIKLTGSGNMVRWKIAKSTS